MDKLPAKEQWVDRETVAVSGEQLETRSRGIDWVSERATCSGGGCSGYINYRYDPGFPCRYHESDSALCML